MGHEPPAPDEDAQELVSVMLEPIGDRTDEELLRWLKSSHVDDAEILAPRFISASIPPDLLAAAEKVARVSIKSRKEMR